MIKKILIPVLLAILITQLIIGTALVTSESMESFLLKGSMILIWKFPYLIQNKMPQKSEVICFRLQNEPNLQIKRVIGTSGDHIQFQNGKVYLNGDLMEEPYLSADMKTLGTNANEYDVPGNCVFVMGDNRTNSSDSRSYSNPYIPVQDIKGKYICTLW